MNCRMDEHPRLLFNPLQSEVQIQEEAKKELQERFTVIYTGQRRLARNLLRDVVGDISEPERNQWRL